MAKLRVIAHRRVDIQDARFADKCIFADGNRSGVNEVGLRPVTQQDRVLAQHCIAADTEHIGADWDNPRMDDGIVSDLRAKQA